MSELIDYFYGSDIDVLEEAHPNIKTRAYTLEELQMRLDMGDVLNQTEEDSRAFDRVMDMKQEVELGLWNLKAQKN